MKAAIIKGKNNVECLELDRPEPGANEVRISVIRCGICGSDLHSYLGRWKPPAFAPGHELVGTVEKLGPGANGLRVGDRVVVTAFSPCGTCANCLEGKTNLCDDLEWLFSKYHGGLSEFAIAPQNAVRLADSALSDQQAAMIEPAAVAWHACTRFGRRGFERALVIGAGTIGLLCTGILRATGTRRIVTVAKHDHQARLAEQFGADEVVRPGNEDVRRAAREKLGPKGGDLVIDTVAAGNSMVAAIESAAKGAGVVLAGGAAKPLLVQFSKLVTEEVQIVGSNCYAVCEGRHDYEWVTDLMKGGKLDTDALVTNVFPLEKVAEAFATAADKTSGSVKVQVAVREG